MSLTNPNPELEGYNLKVISVVPDDATPAVTGQNAIPASAKRVTVSAVTNDANDWIILPPIADVPVGHEIHIFCTAGTNFELRTPASSNTKINNVDADGTQEYLCTDTDTVIVRKNTTTTWIAVSLTNLGAVRTAVIPD